MADSLGDRMKLYENVERKYLTRRMPTLIRLDGKSFHSFTSGFYRPFDGFFMSVMQETAKFLCENIQGCKLAYTQSDEITLLLTDYDNINTDAWFDKNVQKMCSVSASMATLAFNKYFHRIREFKEVYQRKQFQAMFDSRVYNIPKEEVCNAFIWRQQDATRNAIQMVGQFNFSHKQLQGKNCNQIQEMLFQEKEINFNDIPTQCKRGVCIVRETYFKDEIDKVERSRWLVDREIPVFTQDRNYIERYL